MISRLFQRAFRTIDRFVRNQSGSIIIYTGAFMAVGVGGAALSIDIGRIVLLKTQMQNRADAAALAGAAQLDAQTGAIERARTIMKDSMQAFTTAGADVNEIVLIDERFYVPLEDGITRGAETTDDTTARFAHAIMRRMTLSFFYAPAMNLMSGQGASNYTELDAYAIAMSDPFICKTQPMMICNPLEDNDPLTPDPIPDDTYAGYSIILKQGIQGGGTWVAGNFGLLELPTDADYSAGGAAAVEAALEAMEPGGCYGYTVVTAPGSMTVSVADGINTRWGMPTTDPTKRPAPNVMNYKWDNILQAAEDAGLPVPVIGDGIWPRDQYWIDNHNPDLATRPSDLADATRYQTYLYEQGEIYWTKNSKKTLATELDQTGKGYTKVDPALNPIGIPQNAAAPDDNWSDGMPPPGQTVADNTHERRILRVNIMNCVNNDVQGKGDYPSEGNYLEIFLTEQARSVSSGAGIYGEIVRKMNPRISLEFHGNVRLVE